MKYKNKDSVTVFSYPTREYKGHTIVAFGPAKYLVYKTGSRKALWEDYTEKKCCLWIDGQIIPFMGGRPVRDTVINSDDILNLRITLETTNFYSFLEMI